MAVQDGSGYGTTTQYVDVVQKHYQVYLQPGDTIYDYISSVEFDVTSPNIGSSALSNATLLGVSTVHVTLGFALDHAGLS